MKLQMASKSEYEEASAILKEWLDNGACDYFMWGNHIGRITEWVITEFVLNQMGLTNFKSRVGKEIK